jgi:general stress protein YciG
MAKQRQSDSTNKSQAGRKNEQESHAAGSGSSTGDPGRQHGESQGGSGSFADDPEKASEAGRKGGHNSHGHR